MTYTEALDTFVKHSQFYELYAKEMYIPRGCETIVHEIKDAYKVINPEWNQTCMSCGAEFIIDTNRYRLQRIKDLEQNQPKRYEF